MSALYKEKIKRNIILIKGFSKDEGELNASKKMIQSFVDFFKSFAGGAYRDDEIITLLEPKVSELKNFKDGEKLDYVIVVFIGHGATQEGKQLFKLNSEEIVYPGQLDLHVDKQLIILESCRVIINEIPTIDLSAKIPSYMEGGVIRVPKTKSEAKNLYNLKLKECENGIVVCFACKTDEEAHNFYFSSSIILNSLSWYEDPKYFNTALGIQELMKMTRSTVSKLASEKKQLTQTPEINGDLNFPFAVCKY
jgi:hypothetical protein